MKTPFLLLAAFGLFVASPPARSEDAKPGDTTGEAVCVGLKLSAAPAFSRAAKSVGLMLKEGGIDQPSGRAVIYESRSGEEISDAQAEALGEYVRKGGGLLVSVRDTPGRAPMRLAFMLPTTAWMISATGAARDAAAVTEADATFFGQAGADAMRGLKAPFFFEFRPFHAVERGQARYDAYERPAPWAVYTDGTAKYPMLPPHSHWWTRSLLNRDWQVKARLDDLAHSPLLLTGRYGAGHVAVIASSIEKMPDSPATEALWNGALRWINSENAGRFLEVNGIRLPAPQAEEVARTVAIRNITADAKQRLARVTVAHGEIFPVSAQIVARILTWEGAVVGDSVQKVDLAKDSSKEIEIPFPKPSSTGYAALESRDAFHVEVAALSPSGSLIYDQKEADVDFTPPVQLSIATEEVRSVPFPFPGAPEPAKPMRMGIPIGTYAYAPGQTVNATVTLTNHLQNLAPRAKAADETAPDNKTLAALTDGAAQMERGPDSSATTAWGYYEGRAEPENVLRFTLAKPAEIADVVLIGAGDTYRNQDRFNPDRAIVELDGKTVATVEDLAARFLAEHGLVRIPLPHHAGGAVVRIRLSAQKKGTLVRLGEVEIEGAEFGDDACAEGALRVSLRNVLTGALLPGFRKAMKLDQVTRTDVPVSFTLPKGANAEFYRIEAVFKGASDCDPSLSASAPVLAVQPAHPLTALSVLKPADAPQKGFIVTRGFREFFDYGVGTEEFGPSWGQPDDLVWAYAHNMKQLSVNARTRADRLYVSESDFKHYSTPWRQFDDGREFYDVATAGLIERMKLDPHWKGSSVAILGHSDRWDAGPDVGAMHAWQDYEGFDAWLRKHGYGGLSGKTHTELNREIEEKYRGPWEAWHQERYAHSVETLRDAFAKEGKKLVITAQGVSLIPNPADAATISEVVRGMSDDCTWGMQNENVPFTTGRQLGAVAFNPWLAMSTLNQWGYVSNALNNPQWHVPVSTTEPSRRALYDRAFRGMIRPDGSYASMHTYGYNDNAGYAYTLSKADYTEWERVQEKHSLLTPDAPLGAGLVITTAHLQSVENRRFTCGGGSELPETRAIARATQLLQESGVGVSFSANAGLLEKWQGHAPLVLLNVEDFGEKELAALRKLVGSGTRVAAFCGAEKVPAPVAAIFGVSDSGVPVGDSKPVNIAGRIAAQRGGCFFFPASIFQLFAADARAISPLLCEHLQMPFAFPEGTTGYGFQSNGRSFVVVEDWLEKGREVALRIRAKAGAKELRAVDANEHTTLAAHRDGADWIVDLPLRPGDAALVAFEEL